MVYENKEAKASEGGTTENERKHSVLGSIRKIMKNTGAIRSFYVNALPPNFCRNGYPP